KHVAYGDLRLPDWRCFATLEREQERLLFVSSTSGASGDLLYAFYQGRASGLQPGHLVPLPFIAHGSCLSVPSQRICNRPLPAASCTERVERRVCNRIH